MSRFIATSGAAVYWIPTDAELGTIETRVPEAKWAVNQSPRRKMENRRVQERKNTGWARPTPSVAHGTPQASFPNRRIREHVERGAASYE